MKTEPGEVGRDSSVPEQQDTGVEPCAGGLGSGLPGNGHHGAGRPVVSGIRAAHSRLRPGCEEHVTPVQPPRSQ